MVVCVCVRALTHLHAGVGPVVVRAVLSGDAAGRATLALVPEAHPPLLGLLEDLDLGLGHCGGRGGRTPARLLHHHGLAQCGRDTFTREHHTMLP